MGIKSRLPIKSVVIYDRDKVFRRFLPNTTNFHTTLAGYHDRQRFLVLVAEDVQGHRLISSALYTSDRRQSQYMCTDLQNTINTSRDISPEGQEVFYPGVGYGVTGWDSISVAVATADIVPACGFEFGGSGWGFGSSAFLPGLEGNCWTMAARDMAFSTGDCNVLRDVFDVTILPGNIPAEIPSVKTVCRHTAYTPRLDGLNIHRAQHSVTLLRDYSLPEGQKSEFLRCMGGGLAETAFPTYVVVDESGHKTTAARDAKTSLDLTLKPGSYFASFPYMWGSFAIMPLKTDVHLRLRGGAFDVGHDVTGSMSAGTTVGTDVIYICGKFGSVDEKDFDHFRRAFGLASNPSYKYRVNRGRLMSTRYIFDVQAEGGWASAEIGQADMGSDLPINVRGLSKNWDVGFLDLDTHELRRVGIYEGKGILARNIDDKGIRFACGNMVTCDNPGIVLNIFQRAGKWVVEAHNPMATLAAPRVRVASWLKGVVPPFDRVVRIPLGSTVSIAL
ncbi:MAG: hypothetical protein HYX78_10770 [Armatimonadetes bacterium]|nr:hypothetical protein [Armatimonadota bacterium]